MFMTSAVYRTKRLDEVRPPPGRRESETPELLASYLAKIGRGRLLTHQEEISLSKRARAGDQRARNELVKRNLRLVVSVAKRYRGMGAPLRGPHPGGQPGLAPGGGEVRSGPRPPLLHLRRLVDQAGRWPSRDGQGPGNPGPCAHGREDKEDDPHLQRALGRARARTDRRRGGRKVGLEGTGGA